MMRVKIKINSSDDKTLTLEDGHRYLFGRRKDCDVVLENFPGLSRTHFSVDLTSKPYKLEVIENSRPLVIGAHEVTSYSLTKASIFELEPYVFIFELDDQPLDEKSIISQPELESHFDDITQAQSDKNLVPYITLKSLPEEKSIQLRGAHWIAGRDESCDIPIDHSRSSRQHFELFCKEDRYFVRDLSSAHGTYVAGEKISATTPRELRSGDLIEVEGCHILFELRDPTFEKKASGFSTAANSLKMFSQSWLPSHLRKAPGAENSVVLFEERPPGLTKKQKLQIAAALSILVLIFVFSGPSGDKEDRSPATAESPEGDFAKLTPEQKNMVEYSFRLADNLIKQQKFELALQQLETVHNLVSEYENSKELEAVALQYREIRDQQNYLERQRRQQAEVNERVRETMAECSLVAEKTDSLAEIEGCLQPARLLNPTHPDHERLIGIVMTRVAEKERLASERARRRSRIASGEALYNSAKNKEADNDLLGAIKGYKKHLNSSYPDPKNLKAQSRESIKTLEEKLSAEKESLMEEARDLAGKGEHSRGIASAQKAIEFAPGDSEITDFIDDQTRELTRKLKSIYTESVLEERFGNIDAAKAKWQTILEMDVPNGEYASRAESKLKQYGGN